MFDDPDSVVLPVIEKFCQESLFTNEISK